MWRGETELLTTTLGGRRTRVVVLHEGLGKVLGPLDRRYGLLEVIGPCEGFGLRIGGMVFVHGYSRVLAAPEAWSCEPIGARGDLA